MSAEFILNMMDVAVQLVAIGICLGFGGVMGVILYKIVADIVLSFLRQVSNCLFYLLDRIFKK